MRVGVESAVGPAYQLNFAGETFQKRKKLKPAEVDALCRRYGMNPENKNHRSAAAKRGVKERWDNWIDEHNALRNPPPSSSSAATQPAPGNGHLGGTPIDPASSSLSVATQSALSNGHLGGTPSAMASDVGTPVDPAMEAINNAFFGSNNLDETVSQSNFDRISKAQNQTSSGECAIIKGDSAGFCAFFSKINITTTQPSGLLWSTGLVSMTEIISRNPVSSYYWRCPNTEFGCKAKFVSMRLMNIHAKDCIFTSHEKYQAYVQERPHSCDNCNSRFKTAKLLRNHGVAVHWVPKRCSEPDCPYTDLFQSASALKAHMDRFQLGAPFQDAT
ncbi:hypothetical protein QQX98_007922 [Neonectria punicea]|uniref:C2H2-type domain-containing protein n=1 Tax=Neonectria punicea TaxID=979145 RepID=A0ABR1GWL7_9HYPO